MFIKIKILNNISKIFCKTYIFAKQLKYISKILTLIALFPRKKNMQIQLN